MAKGGWCLEGLVEDLVDISILPIYVYAVLCMCIERQRWFKIIWKKYKLLTIGEEKAAGLLSLTLYVLRTRLLGEA